MRTLLTVDWDFFMVEKPEWDLGHRESLLFLTVLWGARGGLAEEMRLTGDERGFWDRLGLGRRRTLWVSESHCFAHSLTTGVDRVVTFDAHHDCWRGDAGKVTCENWLRTWLEGSRRRRVVWVRPGWVDKGLAAVPEDLEDRVEVVEGLEGLEGLELGLGGRVEVHVCRSGCWMPPWLDGAFLEFVRGFAGSLDRATDMQGDGWEALRERWTEKDFRAALECGKRMGELGRSCGYAVVEVPSGMFLRGKEEVAV